MSRFGFGEDGNTLVPQTVVQRGFMTIHTNGDMVVEGVVSPKARHAEALEAAAAATAKEDGARCEFEDCAVALATSASGNSASHADRFTAIVRRQSGHVNSYNMLIQYCIRSNMDLTVMLRDSDARGALFYILNYSTKTEQTLDVLLNLLAPVVERIQAESEGAPSAETAVRLVRSCLCKSVSNQAIGAPAAASKVLGRDDHKISHVATNCPMAPLLAWSASEVAQRSVHRASPDSNNGYTDDNGNDNNSENGIEANDDDDYITISAAGGSLKVSIRAHHLYLQRCKKQDTGHPLHDMSYFVWHRRVRVEKLLRRDRKAPKTSNTAACRASNERLCDDYLSSDDESSDDEPSGDNISTTPSAGRTNKTGRPSSKRYPFVGDAKQDRQQV